VFLIFAVITVFALYKFGTSKTSWREYGTGDVEQDQEHRLADSPRPQVALETKKFEVDIPEATQSSRVIRPPPPVSSPDHPERPSKTPPPITKSKKPAPEATPIGADGHDNDSPTNLGPNRPAPEDGKGRVEVPALPSSVEAIHWKKQREHFPVPSGSIIQLPSGSPKSIPKIQFDFKEETAAEKADRESKLNIIKSVFNRSWSGYKDHAWLQDELKPVSGEFKNPFAHWGATLVDSLDTLWIMGLKDEFEEAVKAVEKIDFTTSPRPDIPLFETTIRYMGGLLAAYDIAGNKHENLLKKAKELGEVLISAFDTPNRMPQTYYYWRPSFSSQPHRASNRVVMAEIGSLSMEFTRLAQITGEAKYYDAIARITNALHEFQNKTRLPGMWPTYLDASGCKAIDYSSAIDPAGQAPMHSQKDADDDDLHSKEAEGKIEDKMVPLDFPTLTKIGADKEKEKTKMVPLAKPKPIAVGVEEHTGKSKMVPLDLPKPINIVSEDAAVKGKIKNWDKDTTVDKSLVEKATSKVKRQLDDDSTLETELADPSDEKPTIPTPEPSPSAGPECEEQGLVSSSDYGSEQYTLGGLSDSTYEYLPKEYLLLGGLVGKYKNMYEKSIETVKKNLIFRPMLPKENDILMSGGLSVGAPKSDQGSVKQLEGESAHLTCFAGGMFGLGAKIFNREEDLEIAKKLTEGCVWAYSSTSTGIMPESFNFVACESQKECKWNETKYWDVLDPNADDRILSYKRQMETYEEQMSIASSEYQAALASFTDAPTEIAKEAVEAEATPTPTAHAVDLQKRQLDDEATSTSKPKADKSVVNDDSATSEPKQKFDKSAVHDDANPTPTPTKVMDSEEDEDEDEAPDPSLVQPSFPVVYSPPPPLPHEEYVKNRIQEERLPPGSTNIRSRSYILRPEAIESVFYMYRITGDQHWRRVGWTMFKAINDHTSTVYGNSAIDDVTKTAPEMKDEMESFWLAETLKYFYLLFSEEGKVSLDEWVLNTEAHPFRRPKA
jgi:mannosyl-oligosaccharide alpha-1,2-mannosidase